MDPTVQVALIGIFTTVVTTAGVVLVAVVNSKKERGNTAESAMEMTLRERIILRDEQIDDLRGDLKEKEQVIMELIGEIEILRNKDKGDGPTQ